MKLSRIPFVAMVATLVSASPGRSEEAHVSVYVVDRSEEFAEMGAACLSYSPSEPTGKNREILGIAKGPPGSTVVMFAFDRDKPHRSIPPVIAEQTAESKPVRFPAEGFSWPYDQTSATVELYVAVFDKEDKDLAKISEYAEWLNDALVSKNEVEALLHADAIKKRLSNLLRQRAVTEYRVKFDAEIASLPEAAAPKAAVTRGNTEGVLGLGKKDPKASIAAVRRGLKTLDEEWTQDSRTIRFGIGKPGILVFPIATPPAP